MNVRDRYLETCRERQREAAHCAKGARSARNTAMDPYCSGADREWLLDEAVAEQEDAAERYLRARIILFGLTETAR